MERRPRSPTGRNAPGTSGGKSGGGTGSRSGPKTGMESGFRKRGASSEKGNFQTRDGKEGFRSDSSAPKRDYKPRSDSSRSDGPKSDRPYGDRPQRDNSDRPQRSYGDRPQRDNAERQSRSYGDKPDRGGYADKPKRSYGDRPQRDNAERPSRSYNDRPPRDNADRPAPRSYGDRPDRGGYADKPKRSYGDKPSYNDKPKRSYGDKPDRGSYNNDRPQRSFADKPARGGFADKPKRSFGGDRPQYDRDERPRSNGPRIEVSVYGIHAVTAALLNPERQIKAIYATEQDLVDLQPALESALEDGIILPEVTIVEREALSRALPRDAVHQGVALDAKPLEEIFLHDIIRKAEVKKKSVVVLLDQVTDPHNIGAIVRSACAFGADAIVVQSRNAPELSGLIAKTASGAAEYVPLVYETNLSRAIEQLKEAGFFSLALDERGQSIGEAPSYEKTLLVLGAEGPGLRPLIKEHCDLLVKLPTTGAISSLNVSNAAAIALFSIASKAK